MGLASDRASEQGLAGARGPGHQHAARAARPGPVVAAWVAQVVDHLADLRLHRGVAGHVGESGGRPLGVDDPRLRLGQAAQAAHAAQAAQAAGRPAYAPDDDKKQAADSQQGQQPEQH